MTAKNSLLKEFEERGIIHDISHRDELDKLLTNDSIVFYCGFDPTASSLHVGSLLPLTIIKRLANAGHNAIILVGAVTGMIGDPSGKSSERSFLDNKILESNCIALEKQINSFIGKTKNNNTKILYNSTWLSSLSLIQFLKDLGKDFTVNYMMAKDSVKSRLTEREQGISYTEFSYMLLQAYDFNHLYKNFNCRLQIGGSDQWGNITAGLDYIRKSNPVDKQAFGFTFPLVTKSSGQKFGKSESGTIWLSKELTSPYAFYQFWLNTQDEDLEKYFKYFSFLSLEEIKETLKDHFNKPEERLAQKKLAEELTCSVHGKDELLKAQKATYALFSKSENISIDADSLMSLSNDIPSINLSELGNENKLLTELMVDAKACSSKSASRKLIQNGGVYINSNKITDVNYQLSESDFIDEKVLLLRTGKKNYYLIIRTI